MRKRIPANRTVTRELIRLAYACATDPLQLPELLAEYTKAVGAEGSGLVVQDLSNHNGNVTASWGFDPYWERKYADHYASTNVWIQRMAPLLQPGRVLSSEAAIGSHELIRTEFYNDFLRPQRLFHSFGAAITRENDVAAYITSVRSKRGGFFDAAEQQVCRELAPHLESALRIRHHFAGLEAQLANLSGAMDRLPQGIVITDGRRRVLFTNRSAAGMLKAQNGLWIAADGLRALRSNETAQLRGLLARAAATVAGRGEHPGGVMRIERPGRPALRIAVAPLEIANGSSRVPAAIVIIAAPRPWLVNAALLEQLFGLTPAEARLTAALAAGKSVKEFAEAAAVSLNTARTHLKSVFAKTGVKRQAALVREVLTTAEQLRLVEDCGPY